MGTVGFSFLSYSEGIGESIIMSEDSSDDIGEEVDIQTVLTGTWRNTDGTLTLTLPPYSGRLYKLV